MAGTQKFPVCGLPQGSRASGTPHACSLLAEGPLLPRGEAVFRAPQGHGCSTLDVVKQCWLLTEGRGEAKGIWQLTGYEGNPPASCPSAPSHC